MFGTLRGRPYLLWRAVNEHGVGLDILVQERGARATRERERRIAQGDFLLGVRGFPDPKRTQKFLACFGPIRQYLTPKRHLICASLYRQQPAARFVAWREFAELALNPSTIFCQVITPAVVPYHSQQVDRSLLSCTPQNASSEHREARIYDAWQQQKIVGFLGQNRIKFLDRAGRLGQQLVAGRPFDQH